MYMSRHGAGYTLVLQATMTRTVPVAPGADLVYVGRRGAHPAAVCAMDDDPVRARNWIFAVQSAEFQPAAAGDLSLQSVSLDDAGGVSNAEWKQLTPWLACGCVHLTVPSNINGLEYTWPYPADQSGTIIVLTPAAATTVPAGLPDGGVYFAKAAAADVHDGLDVVDGVPMTDGDRVIRLDASGARPVAFLQYEATTKMYTSVTDLSQRAQVLVIVEEGRGIQNAGRAWYLPSTDPTAAVEYGTTLSLPHTREATHGAGRASTTGAAVAASALVLMRRRSDGFYPAIPLAATCNILTNRTPQGWSWTYPLSLSDGADRFQASAFTDGLLGPPAAGEFAGVRRRVGPRLLGDARPPEYLRVNFDMGGAVVAQAFAWALVSGGTYPSLTLHGSNAPEFYVDDSVAGGVGDACLPHPSPPDGLTATAGGCVQPQQPRSGTQRRAAVAADVRPRQLVELERGGRGRRSGGCLPDAAVQ